VATAQAPPPSITLSPSTARGVAEGQQRVGPFSIRNGTGRDYDLRIFPVLLGQQRDGGLFVRQDARSRRRARALMKPTSRRARFPRGAAAGASALVRRIPRAHSLYGGLLFEATPRRRSDARPEQIVALLRLNARILLDPAPAFRRVRFTSESIRADQAGDRHLALRVPVRNRGNAFVAAGGRLSVGDASGRTVSRVPVSRVEVLPGAVVELRGDLARPLPAGRYTLAASLRAGSQRFHASGAMRLVGVNEVAARAARIDVFDPPHAYRGDTARLEASFRNTGNVPFRPPAPPPRR